MHLYLAAGKNRQKGRCDMNDEIAVTTQRTIANKVGTTIAVRGAERR